MVSLSTHAISTCITSSTHIHLLTPCIHTEWIGLTFCSLIEVYKVGVCTSRPFVSVYFIMSRLKFFFFGSAISFLSLLGLDFQHLLMKLLAQTIEHHINTCRILLPLRRNFIMKAMYRTWGSLYFGRQTIAFMFDGWNYSLFK